MQYNIGMIGLGVMGRNFLLNMADNGFSVVGYDTDAAKCALFMDEVANKQAATTVNNLQAFCAALETPRKIIALVPAGKPVDDVIESLLPYVDAGDIIVDSGNSFFKDTQRRVAYLQSKQLHFVGMGISGGEKGARFGPSIMPGGNVLAWQHLQPILEAVSAKVHDEPCVCYTGKDAAGHYVKMVHNGIEYGIMQIISEIYEVLKKAGGLQNTQLQTLFEQWNNTEIGGYLLEITTAILVEKDAATNGFLVDYILDVAGSKGTGKWTSQEAMNLGIAIPTIDMAVAMRAVSAIPNQRKQANALYASNNKVAEVDEQLNQHAFNALYAAIVICYAQGLSLISAASKEYNMDVPLADIMKIWRGGCIIRSQLLTTFYNIFKTDAAAENILLHPSIANLLQPTIDGLKAFVTTAVQHNIAVNTIYSTLGYLQTFSNTQLPINLVQAQRDYFGSHTFKRIDKEGTFHHEWGK
jgi:6-phosphogluconate dehydrogenase